MTKGNPTTAIDPEASERWVSLASTVLGQVPWFTTVTGLYSCSLYQPSIYHGKEPFLLVPFMVGLVASWASVRWPNAIWVIVTVFFLMSAFIYWVYDSFGPLSPIHPINWILSYCAFALFVATLARVALDIVKSIRPT
jgi:hypothetical protein